MTVPNTVPAAANDNQIRVEVSGLGNLPWRVNEHFGELNDREFITVARPLIALNEDIIRVVERNIRNGAALNVNAVYVIGDVYGREVKIGKAANPITRLAQLQTGNPSDLFIHRVFWVPARVIDGVERAAHEIAEGFGRRLRGEWFKCSPHEAHVAVEDAIRWVGSVGYYRVMTPSEKLIESAA